MSGRGGSECTTGTGPFTAEVRHNRHDLLEVLKDGHGVRSTMSEQIPDDKVACGPESTAESGCPPNRHGRTCVD